MTISDSLDNITLDSNDIQSIERFENNYFNYKKNIIQNGGIDKEKLNKNIQRLYNCYVLSQNLSGGVNNKLSLQIKNRLDKKTTELKNLEGGDAVIIPFLIVIGLKILNDLTNSFVAKLIENLVNVLDGHTGGYYKKLKEFRITDELYNQAMKLAERMDELVKKEYMDIMILLMPKIDENCRCKTSTKGTCDLLQSKTIQVFEFVTGDRSSAEILKIVVKIIQKTLKNEDLYTDLANHFTNYNKIIDIEQIIIRINGLINFTNKEIKEIFENILRKEATTEATILVKKLNPTGQICECYKQTIDSCKSTITDITNLFNF